MPAKKSQTQIQTTLYSPAPEVTAIKLLQGKSTPLEVFKSLDDKRKLLDMILKRNGGGDAVLGVLLFLKRTLNEENFTEILEERPKALEHYVSYLKSNRDLEEEAFYVLKKFGRHQEVFSMRFCEAMSCIEIELRKQKLKRLIETINNGAGDVNVLFIQIAQNALKLLEFVQKERNTLSNMVDINSAPIEVLYACCRKYTNWKEDGLTCTISPYRLSLEQKMSPAQFEWTALNERTISQAFADLESIFERSSTWHPIKQKQFHINFALDSAILRLHALKAPNSVLHMFLSKISNSTEKLALSQRVHCTKATIDALVALKNPQQLTQLRENLPERSEEQFYCDKALKSFQNKRWSTNNIKIKL